MTFLVNPPMAIEIDTDAEGAPQHLRGEPLVGPVQPVHHWLADVDWWRRPVRREYWKVLLRGRLLCEIYRDLEQDAWFLERVHD